MRLPIINLVMSVRLPVCIEELAQHSMDFSGILRWQHLQKYFDPIQVWLQ